MPQNLKPIILQDSRDIHTLFDYLIRDLEAEERKKSPIEIPFSPLQSVEIRNYFSVKEVALDVQHAKQVFLMGENGAGKTLLLQGMALALAGNQQEGIVIDYLKDNNNLQPTLKTATQNGEDYIFDKTEKTYPYLLGYGVSRFRNDSDKADKSGYLTLFSHDLHLENPVKWLQHIDYKESKNDVPPVGLATAKGMLEDLLDKKVTIDVTADEVWFIEHGTRLRFNQLASGYQMVLVWVCDMVARLTERQPSISGLADIQGIVLIDEVEMFLHPQLQYELPNKLSGWFPNVQFIFTTHSPIVALGASKESLFFRVYKEAGETRISEAYTYEMMQGYMANGILTSPLFGLESAGMRESTERDTNETYLDSRIHRQISAELAKRKAEGKVYFSEQEIDDMIAAALAAESQAPYGDDTHS